MLPAAARVLEQILPQLGLQMGPQPRRHLDDSLRRDPEPDNPAKDPHLDRTHRTRDTKRFVYASQLDRDCTLTSNESVYCAQPLKRIKES